MATDPRFPETASETWKGRIRSAWEVLSALLATRAEIFREELAEKGMFLARGVAGLVIAVVLGSLAVVLLTALIAALFALLFGSLWAGLLATFLLYAAGAGASVAIGARALSRVRPFDFPITREEIRKDWDAVRGSSQPVQEVAERPASRPEAVEDLEERFREGSE